MLTSLIILGGDQGGMLHDQLKSTLLESAINDAITYGRGGLGTIVTFASGNWLSIDYPANTIHNAICVGSISSAYTRASNSGHGGHSLDVVAPGVSIISTIPDNKVQRKNGTSMACPHVSGVAALMLSVNPLLKSYQVSNIIDSTCTHLENYN